MVSQGRRVATSAKKTDRSTVPVAGCRGRAAHRDGAELDRPLVHGRPLHQNPFGPTLFFGVGCAIYEVMQRNDYLSSVTIFYEPAPQPEPQAQPRQM